MHTASSLAGSYRSMRSGGNTTWGRVQEIALRQGSTEDHKNCSCRYWGEAHGEEVKSCGSVGMLQTHRKPGFIAVLLMEQLVLDHHDCSIKEVLYSFSLVPDLTGITVHLAKNFIHCPFIPAIVNHLRLCIFMPKPAINHPAMLLTVRNCQVPFLLFIYFCLGNEYMVNKYQFKWYSTYSLAYTLLLRATLITLRYKVNILWQNSLSESDTKRHLRTT